MLLSAVSLIYTGAAAKNTVYPLYHILLKKCLEITKQILNTPEVTHPRKRLRHKNPAIEQLLIMNDCFKFHVKPARLIFFMH